MRGAQLDDQHMSEDSTGSGNQELSSLLRNATTSSSQILKAAATTSAGRRAVRGYQSRRAELHKSRSKNAIAEPPEPSLSELQGGWSEKEGDSYPKSTVVVQETAPSPQHSKKSGTIPMIRHASVKDKESPPQQQVKEKQRPLSAIEPHTVDTNTLGVPASHSHLRFRATDGPETPLFNTITALSPSGEQEVFREVNIEEAIARSQGNVLSCQDSTSAEPPKSRNSLIRHVSAAYGIELRV